MGSNQLTGCSWARRSLSGLICNTGRVLRIKRERKPYVPSWVGFAVCLYSPSNVNVAVQNNSKYTESHLEALAVEICPQSLWGGGGEAVKGEQQERLERGVREARGLSLVPTLGSAILTDTAFAFPRLSLHSWEFRLNFVIKNRMLENVSMVRFLYYALHCYTANTWACTAHAKSCLMACCLCCVLSCRYFCTVARLL